MSVHLTAEQEQKVRSTLLHFVQSLHAHFFPTADDIISEDFNLQSSMAVRNKYGLEFNGASHTNVRPNFDTEKVQMAMKQCRKNMQKFLWQTRFKNLGGDNLDEFFRKFSPPMANQSTPLSKEETLINHLTFNWVLRVQEKHAGILNNYTYNPLHAMPGTRHIGSNNPSHETLRIDVEMNFD